ncbi:unnamed protein product, partial [Schistocephalus solidus]|uniref:Anion exchange protein n=1 Tax=Schistocephalus solidus TaxID=70667 RepID=A0A183SK46_SCHSO
NTSSIFSEITQLEFGECPPGGINITLSLGQTSPGYWSEKARYIVYEEQYDEVNKQFNPPQYMSISYKHFAHLCRAFRSDLRIISSEADSAEIVMDEIASHIVLENGVENDINARQLRSLLLAQRWHPQTTPELVNKYLSACLPDEAEACCIMTGYMPCLTRSFFYLVRVNSRAQMLGLVEVNAPLRFIVLTLSNLPEEKRFYFHIARCFAALMQEKASSFLPSYSIRTLFVYIFPDILVFEDYAADYAASIQQNSVDDDKEEIQPPPRCSVSFCRRFFPPFKELVIGIRVLAERMPSDYIDAFKKDNVGTMLSSILFIYFVVFGPAITFGNLMLTEVNPAFTISLNIFAAGISTVIYALFAGQPLGSIGPSGPGFIFETIIASFARSTGADFFILRFWVGIYAAIVGVILISLNLSSLASYARRSLEELFSSFICIFLILKAIFTMFKVGTVSTVYAVSLTSSFCRLRTMLAIPRNLVIEDIANASVGDIQNTLSISRNASRAAVSLFLALLMLIFSLCINAFKRSHFIGRTVSLIRGAPRFLLVILIHICMLLRLKYLIIFFQFRYWVGAFNVPLGILFVTLIERAFFANYKVKTLAIPAVSDLNLSMLVQIVDLKQALIIMHPSSTIVHGNAAFLGFFTAILVFTETALNSVTALKPKAKKPSPFVMDHVITVVVFPLFSAFLGWPFMSGVPVRTIANTMALVKVDPHPPPGKQAEIIRLVEQRVSVLIVGIFVSISIVLGNILRFIPIAALYGMFIYLGLVGLRGLDSVSALLALLTRRKYWSHWAFLASLPKPQLAVFTFLNFFQLSILIMCVILAEFTPASCVTLITPFVLIGCGLIREFLLPRWRWIAPSLEKVGEIL